MPLRRNPLTRMFLRRTVLPVLVLAVGSTAVPAQAQVPDDSHAKGTADGSGNTLIPIPILFRGPETGAGFGAAATYLFRLKSGSGEATGSTTSPSSLSAVAVYTSKKQIITSVESVLRLRGDRLRLSGAMEAVRFPTSFWGIGNESDDRDEEGYTGEAVNLEGEVF